MFSCCEKGLYPYEQHRDDIWTHMLITGLTDVNECAIIGNNNTTKGRPALIDTSSSSPFTAEMYWNTTFTTAGAINN